MLNLDYKKLHKNFIDYAKEFRASAEENGFGIDLMEAFSKAVALEVSNQADSYSTPGYVNFCKDVDENEIVDKNLNKEVIEALKKKKIRQTVEKKEKTLETKNVTKVDNQAKKGEKPKTSDSKKISKPANNEKVVSKNSVTKPEIKKSESSIKNLDEKEKQANQETDALKDKEKFVYASKTGKKYHKEDCIYKKDSFDKMSIDKAKESGKTPCSTCFNN